MTIANKYTVGATIILAFLLGYGSNHFFATPPPIPAAKESKNLVADNEFLEKKFEEYFRPLSDDITAIKRKVRAKTPPPSPLPAFDAGTVAKLRKGGYTLFLRHGERIHGNPASVMFDVATHSAGIDLPDQSLEGYCLTEVGRVSSIVLGRFLSILKIPIGSVFSSPICRAKQSAALAFPAAEVRIIDSLSFVRTNFGSKDVRAHHIDNLRKQFEKPIPPGVNRVFVAHGNLLKHLKIEETGLEELGFIVLDSDTKPISLATPASLSSVFYNEMLSSTKPAAE